MNLAARHPLRLWHVTLPLLPLALGLLAGINPLLAIATAAGLVFVAIVVSDLAVGLTLFILLEYLLPDSGSTMFSAAKVMGLLLVFSWLAVLATRRDLQQELTSEHPGFVLLLFVFLAWVLVSAVWAEDPGEAVFAFVRFFQTAILFLIVYTAIRKREQLVWVLAALAIGGAIAGGIGLLGALAGGLQGEDRLGGTYGEPNELASYLVVGVVIAMTLFALPGRSLPFRTIAAVSGGTCLLANFFTLSRAALIAVAAALLIAIVAGGRWRGRAVALALTVVVVSVSYFAVFAPAASVERVTDFSSESSSGRSDLWEIGIRMVSANPITGVGAGNYTVTSVDYLLVKPGAIERDEYIIDTPNLVHNIYLGVFAELGVVGGLLFLAIIGFSLRCYAGAMRRFDSQGDRALDLLSRGALVATVALLTANFFASEPFSKQLWVLLALGPALLGVASRIERDTTAGESGHDSSRLATVRA